MNMIRITLALLICLALNVQAKPVDFTLKDLEGKPMTLSDHRGKWVVINFWASWCSPCVKELPDFDSLAQEKPEVQFIGVNFEETTAEDTRSFLASLKVSAFPHVKYDGDGIPLDFFIDREGKQLSLKGLPSTFFVDPKGEMRKLHLGPIEKAELAQTIDQVMASD